MGKKLRFKSVISLCGGFLVLWFVVCLFGLLFFVLFWGGGVIFFSSLLQELNVSQKRINPLGTS